MKKNKLLEIVQTGYIANIVLIPTGDVIGKFQFHEYAGFSDNAKLAESILTAYESYLKNTLQ